MGRAVARPSQLMGPPMNVVDAKLIPYVKTLRRFLWRTYRNKKSQEDQHGEVKVEVEPTQSLLKDWKYASSHPKDLIIGDVFQEVFFRSKLQDLCGHFIFILHIEPKNIHEADVDSC